MPPPKKLIAISNALIKSVREKIKLTPNIGSIWALNYTNFRSIKSKNTINNNLLNNYKISSARCGDLASFAMNILSHVEPDINACAVSITFLLRNRNTGI